MTNENKNINELVSDDDDPTAELEILSFREFDLADVELESESSTYGFGEQDDDASSAGQSIPELRSDLAKRTQTIGRLQYDIEQLRAKWLGLETEIEAREQIVNALLRDVDGLKGELSRKDKLLKKRNRSIKSLKAEVRQRDEIHRLLEQQHADLEQELAKQRSADEDKVSALNDARRQLDDTRSELERQRHATVGALTDKESKAQLSKVEEYADTLRYKLQEFAELQSQWSQERDALRYSLEELSGRNWSLSEQLDSANASLIELQAALRQQHADHEQEIGALRFDLGQAQDCATETTEMNTQLSSDLVETRGFKEELERMLRENDEAAQQRIQELELTTEALQQKLDTKSNTIAVLLSELSKKSEQLDSIGEIENVIHEIDDRMSERFDDKNEDESSGVVAAKEHSDRDRITRVLIGDFGSQELRFPLFKNRLTIGRNEDNDIQLKTTYISRRHAVILTEGDATRVIDWGSKNGVFVNSERIKEHFLSNGDIVAIGDVKFRYEERPKRDT